MQLHCFFLTNGRKCAIMDIGSLHEVAKVIDHLSDFVATVFIVGGDFGHDEIRL